MSKSKKPRNKRYDPMRNARAIVSLKAKNRAAMLEESGKQILTDDALQDLGIAYHTAFALMRQHGGEEPFHTLAAAINIAGRFCEMGIGDEYQDDVQAAVQALIRVRERAMRLGKWALDGAGIQAVARGLKVHDAQMASATYNELRSAIEEVFRRNEAEKASFSLAA